MVGWTVATEGMIVDHSGRALVLLAGVLAFDGSQLCVLTRSEVAILFENSESPKSVLLESPEKRHSVGARAP